MCNSEGILPVKLMKEIEMINSSKEIYERELVPLQGTKLWGIFKT